MRLWNDLNRLVIIRSKHYLASTAECSFLKISSERYKIMADLFPLVIMTKGKLASCNRSIYFLVVVLIVISMQISPRRNFSEICR